MIFFQSCVMLSANTDLLFGGHMVSLETYLRAGPLSVPYESLLLYECAIFKHLLGRFHFHMLQILAIPNTHLPCRNGKSYPLKSFPHKHDRSEGKKKKIKKIKIQQGWDCHFFKNYFLFILNHGLQFTCERPLNYTDTKLKCRWHQSPAYVSFLMQELLFAFFPHEILSCKIMWT